MPATLTGLLAGLPAGFGWTLAGIAGLVLLDALLGMLLAIKTRTWDWSRAGAFYAHLLRYVGGGAVAAVVAALHPSLQNLTSPLFYGAAAAVALQFVLGDLRKKALALFLAPSAPKPPAKGA